MGASRFQAARQTRPGGVRLFEREPHADRSRGETARLASRCPRRAASGGARARRDRRALGEPRGIRRVASARKPQGEAGALRGRASSAGSEGAYSDEVLHRARLSPVTWSSRLTGEEIERLFQATRATLDEWIDRLLEQTGDDFPTKVTAFRDEMAVHGKFGRPCPVCGSRIQRIRYAENETNYCPRCQTGGKLLADRSLSRLLKDDWPKSVEELEGA